MIISRDHLHINQAHTSHRPVHAGFLKLICADCQYACVCPCPRLLITSGMMWLDMDLIRLVKQVTAVIW